MGHYKKDMKQHLIHATLAAFALAICCPAATANPTEKQPMQMAQKPVFKNVQDYIEFFRRGGEYYDTQYLPNLMIGTQPDPQALKVLGEALLTDNDDVRDRIIYLLKDIAFLNHRAYELRTPEVIDLMVGPGFAAKDSARSKAMSLLRQYASTSTLVRVGWDERSESQHHEVPDGRSVGQSQTSGFASSSRPTRAR